MIHNANLMSLLSGSETSSVLSAGLSNETGKFAAFDLNLQQQLALLQNTTVQNSSLDNAILNTLQTNNSSSDTSVIEQDLQNFAALLGNSTPTANKTAPDINLADTLSALTNVLQNLQSLETESNNTNQTPSINNLLQQFAVSQTPGNNISSTSSSQDSQISNLNASAKLKAKSLITDLTALTMGMAATGQQIQALQQPVQQQPVGTSATNIVDTSVNSTTNILANSAVDTSTSSSIDTLSQTNLLTNWQVPHTQTQLNSQTDNFENNLAAMLTGMTQTKSAQPATISQPLVAPLVIVAPAVNQPTTQVALPSSISQALATMSGSLVFSANPTTDLNASANFSSGPTPLPVSDSTANNITTTHSNPITSAAPKIPTPNNPQAPLNYPLSGSTPITANPIFTSEPDSELINSASLNTPTKSSSITTDTSVAASATMTPNLMQLNPVNSNQNSTIATMALPLNHPDWNAELANKLQLMHQQNMPAAELQINPAHLGPISIKIELNNDQTTISFTAQHQQVKEAIEASIPKLRDMLGGEQLNLVNVNISQQQSDQKPAQGYFQMGAGQGNGNGSGRYTDAENSTNTATIDTVSPANESSTNVSNGLLNIFA
jgi:flagellar hook-length control protein FliK